jgi:HEPN domain-containing protein
MRAEIKNWWEKALGDLDTAKILFRNSKYEDSAFFCQQAVEKGLKALLLKEKGRIEKIHDLVNLGRKVEIPDNFLEYAKELTLAYVYSRYPDVKKAENIRNISSKFLKYSEGILRWIEKKL